MMRTHDQRLYDGQERIDLTGMLSNDIPASEASGGAAGSSAMIPREDHRHPRLTSATVGEVTTGNTVTIAFTRLFAAEPTIDIVRVYKAQVVPQNLVSVLLGAVFNLFGASVVGTRFSIIALARSDV